MEDLIMSFFYWISCFEKVFFLSCVFEERETKQVRYRIMGKDENKFGCTDTGDL